MYGCCGNKASGKKNRQALPLAAVAVLAAVLIIGAIQGGKDGAGGDSSKEPQAVKEGESLVIPTREISETVKFYPLTVDGAKMEVLGVTAPDGTIRTAFNTCQVCHGSPRAYFVQQGQAVECQACRNQFPMSRVGLVAGGCNPVPIFPANKTQTNETITISRVHLRQAKDMFESW